MFTGDNAMGTIPNCLKLNHHNIRFIVPCPASNLFEQAFDSVDEEELDRLTFPDKDRTPKFKVAERGVFIDLPGRDKKAELNGVKPFWARCLIIWSKSRAKLDREKRHKYMLDVKERLDNNRRYKDKDYAQNQVDNCFKGPKQYLRKFFGNPTVIAKEGRLELVYAVDEKLLSQKEPANGMEILSITVIPPTNTSGILSLQL